MSTNGFNDEEAANGKEGNVVELPPPAKHGFFSLWPLVEGVRWAKGPRAYTMERAKAAGCPVFRCHPGVGTVMVSDHASMKAVMESPADVMDRDDGVGFGCMRLWSDELLNGVRPAQVRDRSDSEPARALLVRVMKQRGDAPFEEACQRLLRSGYSCLQTHSKIRLDEALPGVSSGVVFDWLFGIEGPAGSEHAHMLRSMFGLMCDTSVSETLASYLKRPDQRAKDYVEERTKRMRQSEPFESYLEIGKDLGFNEEEVALHLLFAVVINISSINVASPFAMFGILASQPDLWDRLKKELSGFSGSTRELDALPLLDAMMHENIRLLPRPKWYYRRVLKDTFLPTSDGRHQVRVPKGERLSVSVTARHDEAVFERPEEFDPDRFLRNPELKKEVYLLGQPENCPYACPGIANGLATRLWKSVVASLIIQGGWKLEPTPKVVLDSELGLEPQDVMLCRDT